MDDNRILYRGDKCMIEVVGGLILITIKNNIINTRFYDVLDIVNKN